MSGCEQLVVDRLSAWSVDAGLQVGSRPVELPEGTELGQLEHAVLEVWTPILELLEEDLDHYFRSSSL